MGSTGREFLHSDRAGRHRYPPRQWWLRGYQLTSEAAKQFFGLLFPVACAGCDAADSMLCADCARRLRQLAAIPFQAAGSAPALAAPDGGVVLPVIAAGRYRNELSRTILAFKSHGAVPLARELSGLLDRAVEAALLADPPGLPLLPGQPSRAPVLVPVPCSPAGFRRRGYDPLAELLRARRRGIAGAFPAVRALRHARHRLRGWRGGPQKALSGAARRHRAKGSLRVRHGALRVLDGRDCVLVDDVLTTGATLFEAARALTEAGCRVRGAVVLAAVVRPGGAPSTGRVGMNS